MAVTLIFLFLGTLMYRAIDYIVGEVYCLTSMGKNKIVPILGVFIDMLDMISLAIYHIASFFVYPVVKIVVADFYTHILKGEAVNYKIVTSYFKRGKYVEALRFALPASAVIFLFDICTRFMYKHLTNYHFALESPRMPEFLRAGFPIIALLGIALIGVVIIYQIKLTLFPRYLYAMGISRDFGEAAKISVKISRKKVRKIVGYSALVCLAIVVPLAAVAVLLDPSDFVTDLAFGAVAYLAVSFIHCISAAVVLDSVEEGCSEHQPCLDNVEK